MLKDHFEDLTGFSPEQLSPGGMVTLACLLEVSAPKPGNVHRAADFEDVTFVDFVVSAVVLGNVIDSCKSGLGQTIYESVSQTKSVVGTNTNLGLILLLCPLAKSLGQQQSLSQDGLKELLESLDVNDCRATYAAIRLATPGGIQDSPQHDVNDEAPDDLIEAMTFAADRDLIARQFANGFEQVFQDSLDHLIKGQELFEEISQAIIYAHVKLMSVYPDSLIARKNGLDVAQHSQFLAQKAIDQLERGNESFWSAVGDLDFWLRSDGHRRNPGTTADVIAAGIFVGLCNGQLNISQKN